VGFGLLKDHGDVQDVVHAAEGLVDVDGPAVVVGLDGDDDLSVLGGGVDLDARHLGELFAQKLVGAGLCINNGAGDIQDTAFKRNPEGF